MELFPYLSDKLIPLKVDAGVRHRRREGQPVAQPPESSPRGSKSSCEILMRKNARTHLREDVYIYMFVQERALAIFFRGRVCLFKTRGSRAAGNLTADDERGERPK